MRQKFIFSPNNAKEAISVSEAWPWQDLHSSPMRCFKKSAAHIIQVICHFSILYLRNQCTSCIILYFASFCIYIFEVIFFCIEYIVERSLNLIKCLSKCQSIHVWMSIVLLKLTYENYSDHRIGQMGDM